MTDQVDENAWVDALLPVSGTWRGMKYDSRLELGWWVTLETYRFEWRPHPGSLVIDSTGTRWEPDILLGSGEDEILVEVKPWAGDSVERLWKAKAAAQRYAKPVLIFRPGSVAATDWNCETEGACWESADGHRYVIEVDGERPRFVRKELAKGRVLFSAEEVIWHDTKVGMPMVHWSKAGAIE